MTDNDLLSSELAMDQSSAKHQDGYFQCGFCKKNYNRADHLIRHVRSHTREKPYACDVCNKGFARPDLMKRHAAAHDSDHDAKRRKLSAPSRAGRVSQACKTCATSKLKCDDEKPCRRCREKNLSCDWSQDGTNESSHEQPQQAQESQQVAQEELLQPVHPFSLSDQPDIPATTCTQGQPNMHDLSMNNMSSDQVTPMNADMMPPVYEGQTISPGTDRESGIFSVDGTFFPEFIPDSLIPSLSRFGEADPTNIAQEYIHYGAFDRNLQFDFNLTDGDFGLIDQFNSQNGLQYTDLYHELAEPADGYDGDSGVAIGAEAYRRSSLSTWRPVHEDHGFVDQENLSVPQSIDSPESRTASSRQVLSERLPQSSRDLIFGMILEGSRQVDMTRIMKSFPSTNLLDSLIQSFFELHQQQIDAWVHGPTFQPSQEDPETLAAFAASGAVRSTVPTIRKLGYALMEVVRREFPMKFERDNSTTRDLRLSQTFAAVIDIGIWSGNRRRTEIAESFQQPLTTMLRRALRFRRSIYTSIIPCADDTDETLEQKWRTWVEQESFKRLVYHLFCHDGQASMMLHINPLISYADLELPLPFSRQLWEAKTASEWRDVYISIGAQSSERLPSLVDLMHDMSRLTAYHARIDSQLAAFVLLHGLSALVHEYHRLKFVSQETSGHWHALVISSRQQELGDALQHFRMACSGWHTRPEIELVLEVISMLLHMSLEELQLFAGKEDKKEARRVYDSALEWINSIDSRRAVWHAGQVIRAASAMPRGSLTGFFAIGVYYASLALWSYSVVAKAKDAKVAGSRLPSNSQLQDDWPFAFLDTEGTTEVHKFISLGCGHPALQGRHGPVLVADSCLTMQVAEELLRAEVSQDTLPPLVVSICQLLCDLGQAARTSARDPGLGACFVQGA